MQRSRLGRIDVETLSSSGKMLGLHSSGGTHLYDYSLYSLQRNGVSFSLSFSPVCLRSWRAEECTTKRGVCRIGGVVSAVYVCARRMQANLQEAVSG